jgi:hypothetical protein
MKSNSSIFQYSPTAPPQKKLDLTELENSERLVVAWIYLKMASLY